MKENKGKSVDETFTRRGFLKCIAGSAAALGLPRLLEAGIKNDSQPPNILMITADDMHFDSPGIYGCTVPDITPNIDQLASEGMRFLHGHVTISVCQPSRSVWMTGRYPHRNGAKGFEPIDLDVPTLQEQLGAAGYMLGIMAKNGHLDPTEKFLWDYEIYGGSLGRGRNPALYYSYAKTFFENAVTAGKPFFLMANSQDPHRPFAGSQQELNKWGEHLPYSRKIETSEVEVHGFLPDIPAVRQEIAEYYTSVHRCDETVGEVLRALEDAGLKDDTLVMFISDHGMPLPFSKTNCWMNSTRTPWIVRWPNRITPGTVDSEHMISGIDFMPTVLDAVGLPQIEGMDGMSFLPILLGGSQENRDVVFTHFHQTSAKRDYPMRSVITKRYGYIYNAWSDGVTTFKNESQNGLTWNAMVAAAPADPNIAARVDHFLYRVTEELYDYETDPDALINLATYPAYRELLMDFRAQLLVHMMITDDPLRSTFIEQLMPFTDAHHWTLY